MTEEKQRFLFKKSRINEFEGWMNSNGIQHRGPRGKHEVCQIRFNNGKFGWASLYWRYVQKLHYTVDPRLVPIVLRFLVDTDTMNEELLSANVARVEEKDPFSAINRKPTASEKKMMGKKTRRVKGTAPNPPRAKPESYEYVDPEIVKLVRDTGWTQQK
jgi:hypothetical protein